MVRLKDRYLLVNILYPEAPKGKSKGPVSDLVLYNQPTPADFKDYALANAIRAQVRGLFGDYGAGAVERSLQIKYFSPATSTFIVRVSRAHHRLAWAALSFMDRLPGKSGRSCTYRVVHVSGTMRKIEEVAIRRSKNLVVAAKHEMTGQSSDALTMLFGGKDKDKSNDEDLTMVDAMSDEEDDGDDISDG